MKEIRFSVPGDPIGQGRPRFTRKNRIPYDPPKSKQYKAKVQREFQKVYRGKPFKGDIGVAITAWFGVPKSYTVKRKLACLQGVERPHKKPDADNIEKGLLDALNGLAYLDDKQIIELQISKRYAQTGQGRVDVKIEEYDMIGVNEQ